MNGREALDYLTLDPGAVCPCSRYGHDSASCAPVALAVAEIVAAETGELPTREQLDHAMGLVVNDHDDPYTLIRDHGSAEQRELIAGLLEDEWSHDARERGSEAARAVASWIGPVEVNSARELLSKLEDGDPAVWDYLPARPDLSGEWADGLTPARLFEDVTGRDYWQGFAFEGDSHDELVDTIAQAFEEGVEETFEDACQTELRKWAA